MEVTKDNREKISAADMTESKAALAYDPGLLAYDFGPFHPLRPERITAGLNLLQVADLWNPISQSLDFQAAQRDELELVHRAHYIDAVRSAGEAGSQPMPASDFGLGGGDNPPFPGMHEAAALVTGASIAAVRNILSGRFDHAFNPAGGLHHALSDRASGFCIYNDPAVAAAIAVEEYGARVLYVDFDCHHGDGVQWIFYDDPRVMTVSFHETGDYLFPGTGGTGETGRGAGMGFAVNMPVTPYTQDESWLAAVNDLVPELSRSFQPDIIISSHGADTHLWDPLTHLALTTSAFRAQARLIHQLAHFQCDGRWLAVGSGGYDWRRVVPRSWAIVWSEMTDRLLPATIPASWRESWDADPSESAPDTFDDEPELATPNPRNAQISRHNRQTLWELKENLRPFWPVGGIS